LKVDLPEQIHNEKESTGKITPFFTGTITPRLLETG
jgi:hypothetical protein